MPTRYGAGCAPKNAPSAPSSCFLMSDSTRALASLVSFAKSLATFVRSSAKLGTSRGSRKKLFRNVWSGTVPQCNDDAPYYAPNRAPASLRQPTPGELLFEFHVQQTRTFWRVELRDHGRHGVEAQFFDPVDLRSARTFRQDMDPTRSPRAMAIEWSIEERKAIENGDGLSEEIIR
jgi:hypothetical protein